MTVRYALLVMEEHPYGREMLRTLCARGHQPELVVEERSPAADLEREKFLARISGQPVPPKLAEILDGSNARQIRVADFNSNDCHRLLRAFEPELVVLGGTGIIRPHLLAIPLRGTVNAHPGLLPDLRGSSSVAWALHKDLPVGCTTHFVDDGIDTGPVILQRRLEVRRGDTYELIVRRMLTLAARLMADTLDAFELGQVRPTEQDPAVGETLSVMPPDLLADVKARLAGGRFSHFVDRHSASGHSTAGGVIDMESHLRSRG
jgi:methionyl-tRNA formyltransferase